MNAVFVDTSYLLALELANDQNHQVAMQHWRAVVLSLPPLVITSYVFDEVVTFFNSHGYHPKAVQIGNNLLHSPSIQLVHVDPALFYDGWAYFQGHADKEYSLTDCISFVLMQKLGISTAFTFDKHFAQAGFIIEP
jgi:predicted nucleic acid-binding protein